MNVGRWSHRIPQGLRPWQVAGFASFLLSVAALHGSMLNRDGMLYVSTARIFIERGFSAARESFAWPFISIVIATLSALTGCSLESAAHFLNAFFMAGTASFLVATANRQNPEAAWVTCLVVLALPGVNEYRNELLREFGCWFFIMAAFWLAQRWSENPRWRTGFLVQILIGLAALYRPEAAAMIVALVAWQIFCSPARDRARRSLMIGGVALFGLLALVLLHATGYLGTGRIAGEFARINPARFREKADAMAQTFIEYARGNASTILFFGSLALIPVKFFSKLGVLLVPLLFSCDREFFRDVLRRHALFAWGFLAQVFVLAGFVIDLQFLAGRYVGLLLLFAAPALGLATWRLLKRFPRWRPAIVGALGLLTLASTLSLAPGKTQFRDAGEWLAHNAPPAVDVFVGSGRVGYYAGLDYGASEAPLARQIDALRDNRFALYVLETGHNDEALRTAAERSGLRELRRFGGVRGGEVIVFVRPGGRFDVTGGIR